MRHPTVCTADLVTARDIIDCIEWFCYLRQWYGHVVSSSQRTASSVSMRSSKKGEFVSPIRWWVRQSHQIPPRFCGRRDVLWRPPGDERFPDQTWLLEAENSKLKKDLIITMDEANTLKEKIKVIGDDLRTERQLTVEKRRAAPGSQRKDQGHRC